ncbi:hypothetical protein AHAS_Ahas05G0120600 [Arachis hypogaea]
MKNDGPNPEDKWYRDENNQESADKPLNPYPTIPVAKEQFEEWCKQWKNALMVKVLGKHVTFAFMEQRLRRDWEKKAIGHMLKIDRTTSIHSRSKFAGICVEIDLAKQLVPKISMLGCELHLEYEGLYQICFSCGKYGPRSEQCMENGANNGDYMEENRSGDSLQGKVPETKMEGPQNHKIIVTIAMEENPESIHEGVTDYEVSQGPSTANPKGSGNPMEAAKGKEHKSELEGMEMVQLTEEQMKNTEARDNQVRHLDVAIIDAGGGGTLISLSSQDQVDPLLGTRSLDAMGHARGIWCLWNSSIWKVDILEHDRQFVHLKISVNNSTP